MDRDIFTEDHETFRKTVRAFVEREIEPYQAQWEADGIVSREVWLAAGEAGLLGIDVPEEYGGGGTPDYRFYAVLNEELARARSSGTGFPLHNDVVGPYLLKYATKEQKQRWLPGFCSGGTIGAIAMTEPGAGSDLQAVRTSAVDQGDHYLLNGQKTFITNGILADLVVVVAKTDPDAGWQALSLLVVERGMDGFERGRNLEKVGMKAQDTAELFFHDVRVPKENLLGDEGAGFGYLIDNLPQERLSLAVCCLAGAERVFEQTTEYCKERTAFGRPIGSFQHNRFVLAEMKTELTVGRAFLDRWIELHTDGRLTVEKAAMAKWWITELQKRVVDQCVQLHGGYGYMLEYDVAKWYLDSRVQTIYAGTTEIMKEIIGRSLGF